MWEERERRRLEILAAVDQAEASLERGEGRRVTSPEQAKRLADDVRRRRLARLRAEAEVRRVSRLWAMTKLISGV